MLVALLLTDYKVSERRACRIVLLHRTVWQYKTKGKKDDQVLLINRQEIEQIINHLILEGELESIFTKIDFSKTVWVFNSSNKGFPGGIFDNLPLAEKWITNNKLTGTLTKYPVNEGSLDWAIQNNMVNMKPEKLKVKAEDPDFIGDFTSASMELYHYQDGHKE